MTEEEAVPKSSTPKVTKVTEPKAAMQTKPSIPKATKVTKPAGDKAPKPTSSQPPKPTPTLTKSSKEGGSDLGKAKEVMKIAEVKQTTEERIHEEFTSIMYPNVQDNLKLPVEEHVILEEPTSSTGTLSSLHHLDKDFNFGDQFLNDKSSDVEKDKTHAEVEVELMVTVTIQQDTSSVSLMTFKVVDLPRTRPDDPMFIYLYRLENKVMRECCFLVEIDAWLKGKLTLSSLDVLQGLSFFPQMGFTLILATLDGLDVGLLGDVIGENDCDDDG
nr:hypothetical protein [Tanacetum cinerariifolium]